MTNFVKVCNICCQLFRNKRCWIFFKKQTPRGTIKKMCSKNMQKIYRRTPIAKYDFNKVVLQLCNFIEIALWYGCSPVNLLYIFRTPFPRKTSGWLILFIVCFAASFRNIKSTSSYSFFKNKYISTSEIISSLTLVMLNIASQLKSRTLK